MPRELQMADPRRRYDVTNGYQIVVGILGFILKLAKVKMKYVGVELIFKVKQLFE